MNPSAHIDEPFYRNIPIDADVASVFSPGNEERVEKVSSQIAIMEQQINDTVK